MPLRTLWEAFSWRWAESNRRPNKVPGSFLHAYPFFGCRPEAAERQATAGLSSEILTGPRGVCPAHPVLMIPLDPDWTGLKLEGYTSFRSLGGIDWCSISWRLASVWIIVVASYGSKTGINGPASYARRAYHPKSVLSKPEHPRMMVGDTGFEPVTPCL